MTDAVLARDFRSRAPTSWKARRRRALRRLFKRKGAVVGLVVIAAFILLALVRAADRALRSDRDQLVAGAQAAVGAALVRHRRSRPRHFRPRHLWRARLADGGRDLGRDRAVHRRAARAVVRLSRRLYRRPDQPHHRRDAGLPVPDPRDCAGGVPGPEPRQRHDRDRHHRRRRSSSG